MNNIEKLKSSCSNLLECCVIPQLSFFFGIYSVSFNKFYDCSQKPLSVETIIIITSVSIRGQRQFNIQIDGDYSGIYSWVKRSQCSCITYFRITSHFLYRVCGKNITERTNNKEMSRLNRFYYSFEKAQSYVPCQLSTHKTSQHTTSIFTFFPFFFQIVGSFSSCR